MGDVKWMRGQGIDVEWCEALAALYVRDRCYDSAAAARIAAAALRWYAKTETGGDDHAERRALIAACREATNG